MSNLVQHPAENENKHVLEVILNEAKGSSHLSFANPCQAVGTILIKVIEILSDGVSVASVLPEFCR